MTNELTYQIALTLIPNIGAVQAKVLIDYFGNAETIFKARKKDLASLDKIGAVRAKSIKDFTDFSLAEAEIDFIEKYKIQPLFINDNHYPKRLLNCYDSPTMLYYKGTADLNATKIISVIGTRNNSEYGKLITEKFIEELQSQQVLVVSGLAYGIDVCAHKAALQNKLPTVGVLAHGLDTIYPAQHKGLAKEMVLNGGLLTEFTHNTIPDKHNFPRRNRIVAGMADATIVIETAIKGGSMITAELANNYNRDVFAFPGRTIDAKSVGCNYLIKKNIASLITDAKQILESMGWEKKKIIPKKQRELFIELSEDEKMMVQILSAKEMVPIDELYLQSGLSSSAVAAALLNLEMQHVVMSMPGKTYKLL